MGLLRHFVPRNDKLANYLLLITQLTNGLIAKRRKYMDRLENILMKIELEKGYERLTKRERKIISLYYLEGYKDEEIAKIYGVCRQSVNESRQKGIKKLKYF